MPGTTLASVEGDLLGLGEEVVGVAVQHHAPDHAQRDLLLGDDLGRVQQVEVEVVLAFSGDELHAELPLREVAGLDGVPQVPAVEVRVLAGDLLRLVPHQRVGAELRAPVELHEDVPSPAALTKRKVCTPKPCIIR